jgi:flagellin-like protein
MRIRNLLRDDGAVSPVIGVILMVAITVILAAVIASFVLGLGGQTAVAPTADFQFDYNDLPNGSADQGNLVVQHTGGDSIPESELYIRGTNMGNDDNTGNWDSIGETESTSGEISGESAIVSGDRANLSVVDSDYEANVVWEAAEGDQSSTLAQDSGPDA